MKIRIFKYISDFFHYKTHKRKHKIAGKNNIVEFICPNLNRYEAKRLVSFSINGNNNKIIIKSNSLKPIRKYGININISGDNNFVEIEEPNFTNSSLILNGDFNTFSIKKTLKPVSGASFYIADGGCIEIGKECEIGNGSLKITINGDYKNKHKLYIGDGVHIATDAIIRTSDGETLVDFETGLPISEPQDIFIDDDCWITSRCTILKGTYLPKGTIVGANSVVRNKFEKENTLIAGCPAILKKENVRWIAGAYCDNMKKLEESNKEAL